MAGKRKGRTHRRLKQKIDREILRAERRREKSRRIQMISDVERIRSELKKAQRELQRDPGYTKLSEKIAQLHRMLELAEAPFYRRPKEVPKTAEQVDKRTWQAARRILEHEKRTGKTNDERRDRFEFIFGFPLSEIEKLIKLPGSG